VSTESAEARRARTWRDGREARVCDVIEPWAHGSVVRATRYPDYFDLNVVRVEDDPAMTAAELIEVVDAALGDLEHRKLDFDRVEAAAALRPDFDRRGWKTERLVTMRHAEEAVPPAPAHGVKEVEYDAVEELRAIWRREDFPDLDQPGDFHRQEREVALSCGLRVFALEVGGAPVGFTEVEWRDGDAEITSVYVHPERRGGGYGTALTRAMIDRCAGVGDLWIVADDEGRPKDLYARLGFRPVWSWMEFLLPPTSG
jgi:GNAT superfamily N-acetyltransferase